jgi:hypothetical protein
MAYDKLDHYQCFRGACHFHPLEVTGSFEMLVMIYHITQCHIPEYSYLHSHCCETLKAHISYTKLRRKLSDNSAKLHHECPHFFFIRLADVIMTK